MDVGHIDSPLVLYKNKKKRAEKKKRGLTDNGIKVAEPGEWGSQRS
jgi:hypothetical protein